MIQYFFKVINKISELKNVQYWLWFGFSAILLGSFLFVTSEIREAASGEEELITKLDKLSFSYFKELRNPKLNEIALDLTALGSVSVVSIVIFLASILLFLKKKRLSLVYVIISGLGSGLLTLVLKSIFERDRPNVIPHLILANGYSYPSGHSLSSSAVYFTFAILLCNAYKNKYERSLIIGLSLLFIFLISLSRVYLGVHYLSDVFAGGLVGVGWASLLGAVYFFLSRDGKLN